MTDLDEALAPGAASGMAAVKAAAERKRAEALADALDLEELAGTGATNPAVRLTAEDAKAAKRAEEAAKAWPSQRFTAEDLGTKPPGRVWLLRQDTGDKAPGFFPLGKVGILSAPGGTGKTMALASLALAVATGRPWLQAGGIVSGYREPTGFGVGTPGRVALLLAEETADEVHRRLYYAGRMMGLAPDALALAAARVEIFALASVNVALVTEDGEEEPRALELVERLAEIVKDDPAGWAAVILDPLSRFGGLGAEVDNGHATRAIQALERLTKLPGGPGVLVAHHERKGNGEDAGQDAVRGSSALVDGARWAARLIPVFKPRPKGGKGKPAAPLERWTIDGNRAVELDLVKTNYTPGIDERRLLILDGAHGGALRVATRSEKATLAAERKAVKGAADQVKENTPAKAGPPMSGV